MDEQKAIEQLENWYITTKAEKGREAIRLAITALREKMEREENKPLTMEELKEMDGMPVWVEFEPDAELTMWALLEVTDKIVLTNNLGGRSELSDNMTVQGYDVSIYRRKQGVEI